MSQAFNLQEMWKNSCFLTRLVATSLNAAESAGMIIKCVMTSGDLKIINKDLEGLKKDLQTEADRSAQAEIEKKLISAFGNKLQIVGEEVYIFIIAFYICLIYYQGVAIVLFSSDKS